MISRRGALGLIAAALAPLRLRAAAPAEPPVFAGRIASGALPPMAERLPKNPRIVNLAAMGREPGVYGGSLRTLVTGQKDVRLMSLNGYTRLVGYDMALNLVPDVLEGFEVDDDKVFTFHLREGHRWSDGHPLTAADFRHVWEDVLNDKELRAGGLPSEMMADSRPPVFEVLDDLTVRYSWEYPNPSFLPRLAAPQPLVLVLPFHYLRQFHPRYQDRDKLTQLIKKARVQTWTDLYEKMSRTYRPENPDLPMLDPWTNQTPPPAGQFVFERNPYFHRVDENGMQLPYVDRILLNVSSSGIISAKAGAGESDLQMSGLSFVEYPYLKAAEKLHPVTVNLWKQTQGSVVALIPNLTCKDPVWHALFQDVRVRRALSLAIDRHEINMVSFFGLAKESADTVLQESPLYRPEYSSRWAIHDPEQAEALLDAAGCARRGPGGIRLLPDGRQMNIVVETASRSTVETDVLQLIRDHWRRVGVALYIRASQRDIFRSRVISGDVIMCSWGGMDNAVPTPEMSPEALAPTAQDQYEWPLWGVHYLSRGSQGHAPELPVAVELLDLYRAWRRTVSDDERTDIWAKMLDLRSDQVISIGTVNGALQPLMFASSLKNVPRQALYGFDPTCYLGVYMPDTFWDQRSV